LYGGIVTLLLLALEVNSKTKHCSTITEKVHKGVFLRTVLLTAGPSLSQRRN
jgi:hypothetical protein